MDADLVRPPRFQSAAQQRVLGQSFNHFDMRDGFLSEAVHGGAAAPAVATVAHEAGTNGLRREVTRDQRHVFPDDCVSMELSSEFALGDGAAGKYNQAARVLIEAMNDPKTRERFRRPMSARGNRQ